MSWRSVLKLGGKAAKWAGRGAKAAVETGGKALLHPQQTLKGAGTALTVIFPSRSPSPVVTEL